MIQQQRLYFLVPNIQLCREIVFELKSSGLSEKVIHIMAHERIDISDLPSAQLSDKTQIKYGLGLGASIGGTAGLLSGLLVVSFPPAGLVLGGAAILLTTTITGIGFGGAVSALVASGIPKKEIDGVGLCIERGEILLMLDIPNNRIAETVKAIQYIDPSADVRLLTEDSQVCR